MPLKGKRVWILRASHQVDNLANKLKALSAEVIHVPMITIVPIKEALKKLNENYLRDFTSIIFTSPNGVEQFFSSPKKIKHKKIIAIGPGTAFHLNLFGIKANAVAKEFNQEGVLDLFDIDLKNEKVLIPTAKNARDFLPKKLTERGAKVKVLQLYETKCPDLPDIKLMDKDIVLFTSPSTVKNFFKSKILQNQTIIALCIGPITQDTVSKYQNENVYVSRDASIDSLVKLVLDCVEFGTI